MAESEFKGITFNDSHVVEVDECIYEGEYNPRHKRPWLLHSNGQAICVVFADCLEDALDEAADEDKLTAFKIPDDVAADAPDEVYDTYTHLGNGSDPYNIEGLEVTELPIPKRSFCAQFNESLPCPE